MGLDTGGGCWDVENSEDLYAMKNGYLGHWILRPAVIGEGGGRSKLLN